ncbi:MAG: transposase [Chloroflexi bacterium]|nr:transposase [Chloroflexota bacterium]
MFPLGLFTDESIDWSLIEKHLDDMFRIAISIQKGRISASTILRRLSSFNRKNKLYFAFQELGKVMRSVFLLQYFRLPEMRRDINHATTISEAFNEFIQWVGFGNNGMITENSRDEQRKIIKYGHLVANALIFMNVYDQTKILQELIADGYHITPEILAHLGPFRTAHLNRFGKYHIDENRPVFEINYSDELIPSSVN